MPWLRFTDPYIQRMEAKMKNVLLDYGNTKMEVQLPDSAEVVEYNKTYTDPPSVDPFKAVQEALAKPLGMPSLREMSGPDKKIVIGFPDRVKGGIHKEAHRRIAIPLIIEELLAGGGRLENITLLCAEGLHRMNTLEEWYWYLGKDIVDRFYPGRILNHDAEAADLCDFGVDDMGNRIQLNRLMAEADIPIVIGHCAGNPYGGYSGGYKMVVTGHTGADSIASHHCPATMHRDDWLGASSSQHMRKQFESIGRSIEKNIGKKIFAVDAVIGQGSQILKVAAGAVAEVEEATWPLAEKRTNIKLDMKEKADVLIFGLPRNFHYGPGMGTNPILAGLAIGGQLSRCWKAFNEGGVLIVPAVFDGWFNNSWFPSYEETYKQMQKYTTPSDFLASGDAERISHDPDYLFQYSNNYAYHPFHAMSMISGGAIVNKRTRAVIMVGAKSPEYVRGLGYIPVDTFNQAMKLSEKYVGVNPSILCTPEAFSGGVGVHFDIQGC